MSRATRHRSDRDIPIDEVSWRSDRGFTFWFGVGAIAVPASVYAILVVLIAPFGGLRSALELQTAFDGPDGAITGLLRVTMLPGLYLLVAGAWSRLAPPIDRAATFLGALLLPGVYLIAMAGGSFLSLIRDEQAAAPLADIEGSEIVADFGPIIAADRGGAVEPEHSMFGCATNPVWYQSAGTGGSPGAEGELAWLHGAEQLLVSHGFEVSSGWALGPSPTDRRPNRIEARMVVLGIRGDDAIAFNSWLWRVDEADRSPTGNNLIAAVRDDCVGGLTLADVDPFATEPGLPTELDGFTDLD